MYRRIVQLSSPEVLAARCAERLMQTLIGLQDKQETVHLCLTGGQIANQLYTDFATLVPQSRLDPSRLQLWWGDERFVPLSHPDRNSQRTLSILARTLPISSANTHLMPAVDGKADPMEAAFAYAEDLDQVVFDICLLGVGQDGHVASIFPNHPSMDATGKVIGVTNSPKPPAERISLTLPTLNKSKSIWLIAAGEEKRDAVRGGINRDPGLPVGHIQAAESTLWWIDDAAAGGQEGPICRSGIFSK